VPMETADVDDSWRRSDERCDHAATRHGNLNVAETQKRMAAEIHFVARTAVTVHADWMEASP